MSHGTRKRVLSLYKDMWVMSIDPERRRSRIYKNIGSTIGVCVVAAAIVIMAGCSDDPETTVDASGITSYVTGGTQATSGAPASGGAGGATVTTGGTGGGTAEIDAGQSDGSGSEQTGGSGADTVSGDAAAEAATADAASEAAVGDAATEAAMADAEQEAAVGDAATEAAMADAEQEAAIGDASEEASTGDAATVSNCGTTDNVDIEVGPGPFTPTHIENVGASRRSWVFYPEELGRDGCLHPIFNWGPGAMTGPANYLDHLNHLASHGFVIISQPSSGNGSDEIPALEWLMEQNDDSGSEFYQKLDTTKVVMGGHSMGALTTFAMADYAPLTLYILVCGGSGSGTTGAADIHAPALILGGDTDTGTPNFRADYRAITTPVIFLIKSGTDHIMCARNNLAPWTAFMRWHLYGEEKWRDDFFDGGKYCSAPWDSCESKNW